MVLLHINVAGVDGDILLPAVLHHPILDEADGCVWVFI
jgi:hypothetical protein